MDFKKGDSVWWMTVIKGKSTKLQGKIMSQQGGRWKVQIPNATKTKKDDEIHLVKGSKLNKVA